MTGTVNMTATGEFSASFYWNLSKRVATSPKTGLYASIVLLLVVGLAFWAHSLRLTAHQLMVEESKAQKDLIDGILNGTLDLSDL
jgi:hypothetical protein